MAIHHDSTNSHITNITGNLNLVNNAAANIQFIHDNKVMVKAVADGQVELYHGMSSSSEEKKDLNFE